ncbi:MAG: hypothetical protein CSA66_05425 [Proteobacteria bacterium]|nr:MAG: hypothetical protein CSA66_05425 [Pseudomonadota bacterium]
MEPMEPRVNLLLPDEPRWPVDPARPVISLRGVSKGFGDLVVLDGLDLDIHTGLTTVIAGESGTGKSVLLKLMNGLMLPDEGQVLLFGEDTRRVSAGRLLELRKRVTMMFQSYALMDSLTVRENVAFPIYENTGMRWTEVAPLAQALLASLGLGDAGDKLPSELSGGMKKRVSLARAVISNPEVVLFDEPTTGLDPVMIELVDEMIVRTRERFGITSVIISHDMTSTLTLADRLAMLEGGRISAYGTVDEVVGEGRDLVRVFFEGVGRLDHGHDSEVVEARKVWRLPPHEEPLAVLEGVHKRFGRHHVLRGVDLVVPKDKVTVLIGGSGSGKSVIMKHIIGLLQPDEGRVSVFGEDLSRLSPGDLLRLRERYGMVFQGAALLDALDVWDNVAFPLRERGLKRAEVRLRTGEIIDKLRLGSLVRRMPSDISNGQRKRVALARAMVSRPQLIIYDEPTTGQDPVLTRYLDDMIVEAQELFDITSLVVSHDMPSAFRIADQIAMLHKGRILAAEPPGRLMRVGDPQVRRFIYAGTDTGARAARALGDLGDVAG